MMKNTLLIFLFIGLAATIHAQVDPTIDKGSGWLYFSGIPGTTPSISSGSEAAINLNTREAYIWNRDSSEWQRWLLIDSVSYTSDTLRIWQNGSTTPLYAVIPSGTIDTAYLSGDTLGIVFAGDTTEVGLAGISADSTLFATLYALADTAAAIRGDMTSGVTSVATGYGLSGGPITTTGTISADTAQLATVYDVSLKQNILNGTGIVKSTAGTISYLTDGTANWNAAYNDKINSAAVTGTTSKTLTLTQQDAGTVTAGFTDLNGIYAGSGNVPDSTYAKAITAADNSVYGTAIGYFPGYPDQTYRDRGLLISPYNQSVSLWNGDSIAPTQYIYSAVDAGRTSAFVGSGYNGYNNNRTTNNFTTPDSAVVENASLASGATFFSLKEKRIMFGKRTLTPTEHRYFNLWASDTLNNGYLELFEKYRLANAAPSTTSGDTSFMVWIGNGSGTTPSFIEMASISGGGGGGSPQTLSTSNDTLTISGGNSVKLPITELLRDSVTTTTMTVDLETRYQKVVQIDMTSATNLTLTINNPTDAGVYTFHFLGVSGTDNVTWPAAFYDANNTALGTDALTAGTMYTCYYSSADAKYFCK